MTGALADLLSVLAALMLTGVVSARVLAFLKQRRGQQSSLRVKLSDGKVLTLDIRRDWSTDKVSTLVGDVVRLATAGDKAGVQRVLSSSHAEAHKTHDWA
jgi:hypothetical protein